MVEATIDIPKRWDSSFGQEQADPARRREMTEQDVDRLLSIEPFSHMIPDAFPRHLPLRGILEHDTRIQRYRHGDIVVRQGDYGNSAFLILGGRVRVMVDGLDATAIGRRQRGRTTWLREMLLPILNPRSPEVRDTRAYRGKSTASSGASGASGGSEGRWSYDQGVSNVLEIDRNAFNRSGMGVMTEGELFGELAALGRIPRSATVLAEGDVEMLEIRWQGLRDLRKHDEALREYIDARYRRFGLVSTLRESPLLQQLSEADAQKVAEAAEFETYGSYDWYGSYQQLRKKQGDILSKEPVMAEEGHYPNGLIIIRAGFARLSSRYGHGERTFSYLGKGGIYGLAELGHNARHPDKPVPLEATLRAIGYVDVVRIPTRTFERYILPQIPPRMIPQLSRPPERRAERRPTGGAPALPSPFEPPAKASGQAEQPAVDAGMMEFLVENRFINGTAVMMIDMERCTRCDDCVRACATGHDNNPVFVRHGPIHDHHMVATACMHCVDPVCMIGCPTGAIHREQASGEVVINDLTCIGCQTCAASCPYQNIRMVEIRDKWNDDAVVVNPADGKPMLKATKCDLCVDHPGGPACQRACPHDALKRVDMRDLGTLATWLNR